MFVFATPIQFHEVKLTFTRRGLSYFPYSDYFALQMLQGTSAASSTQPCWEELNLRLWRSSAGLRWQWWRNVTRRRRKDSSLYTNEAQRTVLASRSGRTASSSSAPHHQLPLSLLRLGQIWTTTNRGPSYSLWSLPLLRLLSSAKVDKWCAGWTRRRAPLAGRWSSLTFGGRELERGRWG